MLHVLLSLVAAMHDATTTPLSNITNGSRVPQFSDGLYINVSSLPFNIIANSSAATFQSGRAGALDLLSGINNRATNSCNPLPPANCSGHGVVSGCMCICNTGYANDFSNLVSIQWCAYTGNGTIDGRPGVSPTPYGNTTLDTGNNTGTHRTGFASTRLAMILLIVLVLAVTACLGWCGWRIWQRRRRQQRKRKRDRQRKRQRKRCRMRSSTDSSELSNNSLGSQVSEDNLDSESSESSRRSSKRRNSKTKHKSSYKSKRGRSNNRSNRSQHSKAAAPTRERDKSAAKAHTYKHRRSSGADSAASDEAAAAAAGGGIWSKAFGRLGGRQQQAQEPSLQSGSESDYHPDEGTQARYHMQQQRPAQQHQQSWQRQRMSEMAAATIAAAEEGRVPAGRSSGSAPGMRHPGMMLMSAPGGPAAARAAAAADVAAGRARQLQQSPSRSRHQRTHTHDDYSETSETEVEVVVVPHNSNGGRRTPGSQQQRSNPQEHLWPPSHKQQQRAVQSRTSGNAAMMTRSVPGGRSRAPGPQQQQQQRGLPAGVDFREYQHELRERQQRQQQG